MATTPTGRNGRHVRQHVVSESEHVIERAPVPCPSSEEGRAKSRASVCPVKPNTAICVNVEVCVICGLKNFEVHDVVLGVVKLLRGGHNAPKCSYHPFKDRSFWFRLSPFPFPFVITSSPCSTIPSTSPCLTTPSPFCFLIPRLPLLSVQFRSPRSDHPNPTFACCFKSPLFNC